jgi:hypothetical protein
MAVFNAFARDAVGRTEPLTVAAAYAQSRDAALAEAVIGAVGLEIESHLVDLDHVADPVPWGRVAAIAAVVRNVAPGTAVTVEPGGPISPPRRPSRRDRTLELTDVVIFPIHGLLLLPASCRAESLAERQQLVGP